MIKFYANMIIMGRISIDGVPDRFRDAVREALKD